MIFLDVQGTLINDNDKNLINGASELLKYLNYKNIPYVIITNNTKDLNFLNTLRLKGLDIKEGAYLDPFSILKTHLKPCKIAAFGASEFLTSLQILGFELDFINPKALLIASYDNFSFKDFALMIELIQKNIKIIAMHETSIYKKNNHSFPGVGAIMAMLSYATNCKYEVFGKPSLIFYENALKLLQIQDKNASFDKVLVISDDFKGDLLKAKELNMKIALVLSGKIKTINGLDISKQDKVYNNIAEFLDTIK